MAAHDDELLRRFAAARAAGDAARMRQWWDELVTANFDRVGAMVALWGRDGRLSAAEREDAVALAAHKLWRMRLTFRGTTMGEWVLSLRQAVDFACRSVVRDAARARARSVSLDEERPDGGGPRHEAQVAAVLQREAEREREQAAAADLVAEALASLDPRRRLVLERTLQGVPAADVAAELGTSVDNVYALRSRAIKHLGTLEHPT